MDPRGSGGAAGQLPDHGPEHLRAPDRLRQQRVPEDVRVPEGGGAGSEREGLSGTRDRPEIRLRDSGGDPAGAVGAD